MRPQPAQPPIDSLTAKRADDQHGVVSSAQLLEFGLSHSAIQRRVQAGRLHVVYRGVYAVGRSLTGSLGWWKAATLAAGEPAVLSHFSAAGLWELVGFRQRIEVTIPTRAGRARRKGLIIHRTTCLPDHETEVRRNIPVTSVARTLLDLSTVVDRRTLEKALDEAAYLRLYDGLTLTAVIQNHPTRSARLRRCIDEHAVGTTRANEGLEERFFLLCRRYGLPDPLVHMRIGPYEVDFLWPEPRVIVETDDRASHLRAAAFERDHRKTAWLEDRGYRVRRVTSRMLDRDEAAVMGGIERLIDDAGRVPVAIRP